MPDWDWLPAVLIALISAGSGLGAFVLAWQTRGEQRRFVAAQAEKEVAEVEKTKAEAEKTRAEVEKTEAEAEKTRAEVEKTEAEADEIEVSATLQLSELWQQQFDSLNQRIRELEADRADRVKEMLVLYETLMSALARNRFLESERARIVRFLRTHHPDVYRSCVAESGMEEDEGG